MTESEAIKEFNKMVVGDRMKTKRGTHEKQHRLFQLAIDALEKIQMYRAIGTVEECREARERQEPMCLYKKEAPFIGGSTKIQYHCPQCDIILGVGISEKPIIQEEIRYCFNCGQKLYR